MGIPDRAGLTRKQIPWSTRWRPVSASRSHAPPVLNYDPGTEFFSSIEGTQVSLGDILRFEAEQSHRPRMNRRVGRWHRGLPGCTCTYLRRSDRICLASFKIELASAAVDCLLLLHEHGIFDFHISQLPNNGLSMTIGAFCRIIGQLRSDRPKIVHGIWYRTQKEHWLGWLRYYHGPGAYGRKIGQRHDAKYAYNHVVNPFMLAWLVEASGLPSRRTDKVRSCCSRAGSLMARSGAIRRIVPWDEMQAALLRKDRKRMSRSSNQLVQVTRSTRRNNGR